MCSILTRYWPDGREVGSVKVLLVDVMSKFMAVLVMFVGPSSQTLNQTAPVDASNVEAVEGALAM